MKVQINVDADTWRKAKVMSAARGVSLGEFVGEALGRVVKAVCFDGMDKMMPGSAQMNSEVTGKSERDRQMEEIPPPKVNPSILKKGHDWCKVCGVAQVKLPALLCKECAK